MQAHLTLRNSLFLMVSTMQCFTYFRTIFQFYIPCKCQKTFGNNRIINRDYGDIIYDQAYNVFFYQKLDSI